LPGAGARRARLERVRLVLVTIVGVTGVAHAQADDGDQAPAAGDQADDQTGEHTIDAPGETIVVTGLRLPRPQKDVPAATTVIDRLELDRSPQRLADEILRGLPSVGTFRRSSARASSRIRRRRA